MAGRMLRGEENQKGAGFLVFVRTVVFMQAFIRLSFSGWLILPEVRPLLRRTMTDGISSPRRVISFVY